MPDPDPDEMVFIRHPEVDALGGPVTRLAFDTEHSKRGWTIVADPDAPAPPASPTTARTSTPTQKGA